MKKVTVVVSIYNMGKYLEKCVDSLLCQTYPCFEIFLINDGSTDNSDETCRKYASAYPEKITYIKKENGGPSSARNEGMKHATGDFIIFPDPDDYVSPDYLSDLVALNNKYDTDLEVCNYTVFRKNRTRIGCDDCEQFLLRDEAAEQCVKIQNTIGVFPWNKLFHMDIIRTYDLKYDVNRPAAQDIVFLYQYLAHCEIVSYTSKSLYFYNKESGLWSDTGNFTSKKLTAISSYKDVLKIDFVKKNKSIRTEIEAKLFNLAIDLLYMYHVSRINDKKVYSMLKENIDTYKESFFRSKYLSKKRRMAVRLFFINETMFYIMYRIHKMRKPI